MFYLAWRNIARRLGASVLTAFIAFVAVFMLAASVVVVSSLESGVQLSRERLGADIMVLPAGASGNTSEVLFCAEPVNVYLDATAVDASSAVEGVAAVTPQFFTQTVNQSCCSVVGITRIVGIDPASDFILTPWIVTEGAAAEDGAREIEAGLGSDGILLGAAAPTIEGGQASILGSMFHVTAMLEPTGTSVDETIFMDIETARAIAADSPYLERLWDKTDPFTAISCVMVKLDDGADAATVAAQLMEAVPGSVAVRTSDMVASVASQLLVVEMIALVFLVMLVLLAALALAGRFAALAGARMGELGLLRTMGASRSYVALCFAVEVGLVTMAAAVVAVAVACAVSGAVVDTLHTSFNMPGAVVPLSAYGLAIGAGLAFALLLTAVALIQPIGRMVGRDPQETLAKGGL